MVNDDKKLGYREILEQVSQGKQVPLEQVEEEAFSRVDWAYEYNKIDVLVDDDGQKYLVGGRALGTRFGYESDDLRPPSDQLTEYDEAMRARLWQLELVFWREEVKSQKNIDTGALLVFPAPIGILQGKAYIINGLKHVPPWENVQMRDRRTIGMLGIAVLSYEAVATRGDDAPPYRAFCTSCYRWKDDWMLVNHHQTPITPYRN